MSTARDKLWTRLPIWVGFALGSTLCVSGSFLKFSSPLTWLLVLAGAGILLFLFLVVIICGAMPADLQVSDTDESQATEGMLARLDEFRGLAGR